MLLSLLVWQRRSLCFPPQSVALVNESPVLISGFVPLGFKVGNLSPDYRYRGFVALRLHLPFLLFSVDFEGLYDDENYQNEDNEAER
jgi:hypothetical protein